jgi:ornithine decarboxylase
MAEKKKIYNALLQKHGVKLYDETYETYDIINEFTSTIKTEDVFYIIDLAEIIDAYNKWMDHLPKIKPYYAVKCNSDQILLETLAYLGCNFDCASEEEMRIVNEITNDPSKIIFANPVKMCSHIQYARSHDVDLMTFDCEEELHKIRLYHPKAKLVLRIAVDDSASLCKFNNKFGCELCDVKEILILAKILKLNVIGFSFHVGSGCFNPTKFYDAIKNCRTAYDIATEQRIDISMIDIGGGFPGEDIKIKFEDIATEIKRGIEDFFKEEVENNKVEFIAEPGRYFAHKSHILVLNIIGKKVKYNKDTNEKHITYFLNDGVYGSFNCIHFDHAEVSVLPFNERDGELYDSTIFGPTCDSIDQIAKNVKLPDLAIGEWVYVPYFGAYTVSAASGFNGFRTTTKKYVYRA